MTERWQDEVWRQHLRLTHERPVRLLGTTLAFGMAALFEDKSLVLIGFVVYLASEWFGLRLMDIFEVRPTRFIARLALLNAFCGTSGYALIVLLLWFSPDPAVRIAAIGYVCGGFVHTVAVNTVHLPQAISKAIPLSLAAIVMPISLLHQENYSPGAVFAATTSLVLVLYVLRLTYEIYQTERSLSEAQKSAVELALAKGRFLATMSHEMRTPLNTILGLAQMQALGPAAGPSDARPITRAPDNAAVLLEEAALALRAAIEDALSVADRGEQQSEGSKSEVLLRPALRGILARLRPVAEELGIELDLRVNPDVPDLVRLDPLLLRQAVSATLRYILHVAGSGPNRIGIVVSATASVKGGAGTEDLDLFLSLSLDEIGQGSINPLFREAGITAASWMGGAISFGDHARPYATTVLRLTFQRVVPPDLQSQSPSAGTEVEILLVDDIATNRLIVAHLLRSRNFKVTEADSGAEALAMLKQRAFSAVLLDMNMPEMSGQETFAAIRALSVPWAGLPVVALTANSLQAQRTDYRALGLSGFVGKPVDLDLMQAEIERVLAEASTGQMVPGAAPARDSALMR